MSYMLAAQGQTQRTGLTEVKSLLGFRFLRCTNRATRAESFVNTSRMKVITPIYDVAPSRHIRYAKFNSREYVRLLCMPSSPAPRAQNLRRINLHRPGPRTQAGQSPAGLADRQGSAQHQSICSYTLKEKAAAVWCQLTTSQYARRQQCITVNPKENTRTSIPTKFPFATAIRFSSDQHMEFACGPGGVKSLYTKDAMLPCPFLDNQGT
eukprot:549229-Prorocentrum_minimum.AAC.9